MKWISIKEIFSKKKEYLSREFIIRGWIRSFRSNRFITLNDGSTLTNLQVVVSQSIEEEVLSNITLASAIEVKGILVESLGKGQEIELLASAIRVYDKTNSESLQETILQPKKHSLEILRAQAHLRLRTNLFGAIMRIRHHLAFAIHEYFHKKDFFYFHSPIITAMDAEGAGELFRVTSLDLEKIPLGQGGGINYKKDFFHRRTFLTVSGQLQGEAAAMALGKIYTFGPTFRAENSNTSRHLAEFWMIEPEMAFYLLEDNIDLAEDFLKFLISFVLKNCSEDLYFLNERHLKEESQKPKIFQEGDLIEKLEFVLKNPFKRLSYSEAIEILKKSKLQKEGKFNYPVEWGIDLQSEHERYLVEKHFKCPLVVFDYPASIKAFYMKLNKDEKTVKAMDVLFPGIGEIIGGSEREDRHDVLITRMEKMKVDKKELWWYLDTRKFGSAPHSGFGLGFERLVQFVSGMKNIRDVIPFPRTPGSAEF